MVSSSNRKKPPKRLYTLGYCIVLVAGFGWFEYSMLGALHDQGRDDPHSREITTTTAASMSIPGQSNLPKIRPKDNIIQNPIEKSVKEATDVSPIKLKPKTSVDVKKPPPPPRDLSEFRNCSLLQPDDVVYTYGPWDGSPIVVESHKLLFFTIPKVGTTVWKQLFRRMEGYTDWMTDQHPLPHAPKRNGLQYLYDYPPMVADHMMTDPSWTRAIFVRDPQERLLSAYLDKGSQNPYMQFHCCTDNKPDNDSTNPNESLLYTKLQCDNPEPHRGPAASQADKETNPPLLSFLDFLTVVVPSCSDPHWNSQSLRIDNKYWPYINFIGHMETMEADAKRLLQQIGAWDDYGSQGWPPKGEIFAGLGTVTHATDSKSKLSIYLDTPQVKKAVERIVEKDYQNQFLNLHKVEFINSSTAVSAVAI
jgi:Sulfotransferase family